MLFSLFVRIQKEIFGFWNVWGGLNVVEGELSQSEIYALSKWAGTLSQEQISKGAKSALYFSRELCWQEPLMGCFDFFYKCGSMGKNTV